MSKAFRDLNQRVLTCIGREGAVRVAVHGGLKEKIVCTIDGRDA